MSTEARPGRSRALRAPTLVDALIPLVTVAALIAGALALFGLSRVAVHLPFAALCIASLVLSVTYGFTGFETAHATPAEEIA